MSCKEDDIAIKLSFVGDDNGEMAVSHKRMEGERTSTTH
jgi:hypothetical protein